MSFQFVVAASEVIHERQELFLPIWAFPAIAAAFFIVGAVITLTYRDVANRHSHKTGSGDSSHDAHGH